MPKYVVEQGVLEVQRLSDDGRWSPLERVVEVDTDAGTAEVYPTPNFGSRVTVTGTFRVVDAETGEVNPAVVVGTPASEPA